LGQGHNSAVQLGDGFRPDRPNCCQEKDRCSSARSMGESESREERRLNGEEVTEYVPRFEMNLGNFV